MTLLYIHLNTILIFLFIVFHSVVVVSSSILSRTGNSACVHSQWTALAQLRALNPHSGPTYYFCGQKSSRKVTEWNMEEDCCGWDGVSCDPATGYVTGLNLSFSMLSPQIFPIFNLHHLQTLNLACNHFNSTPFPSGFEKLRNLTYLNLSNTYFSGQIHVGISKLTRLVSLDLSSLTFASVELRKPNLESFFMNLNSLKEVYLDYVDLSAHGSNWSQALSSALPDLEVLSLYSCGVNGPIHPSFAALKSLSYLQLSFNNLSSVPTSFENFTNLEILLLESCGMYGGFPENVFRLPKLKIIDISLNSLSGQFPEFPKHSSLQILSLHYNNFDGELPESIGNLQSLKFFSLHDTNFHGQLPESIGNLQSLKFFYISHCKFWGLLPSSLANLTSIIELDIEQNRFTGSLPPFHSTSVPNLSLLRMSSNLLTGEIHSSVFTLPSLATLYLDGNKISGELEEFSNTSSSVLEELYLNDNQLGGVLPKSIFKLPNLIHMSLASNNFNGSMKIEMLHNLKNLIDLDLSSNNLTVENDGNGYDLPQLLELNLKKCNLFDFPIFLKSQVQLKVLNLADNNIRGYVPSWLGNNTIIELDLSGNPIDFLETSDQGNSSFMTLNILLMRSCNISKFPHILRAFHALWLLDLSNNKIEGEIPSWIWNNQLAFVNISHNLLSVCDEFHTNISLDVNSLYLQGNHIKGSLPSGICNMSNLQILDASDNNLSGLIPECLLKLPNLFVLDFQGNRYHQMPSNFTLARNLATLNINGNRLKGKLPRSLANCKMLEILDLGNNMIHDTFPFWLENLSSLKVLVLRNNMFYGQVVIPKTKYVLPSLHIIDLSSNNLTGELSRDFLRSLSAMALTGGSESNTNIIGQQHGGYYQDSMNITSKGNEMVLVKIFTIFVALDLSNNKFHGNIPKEIGELKSLIVLNLSRNAFNGQIPTSLKELSQLESLDFSHNKFSGMIPPQLTSLTFLEVLNLSYNQLAGRIPLGNQFNTFMNSSYIGNAGLCGIPLSRKCNEDDAPVTQDESLESEAMFDWWFAIAGCGFGLVVGLTIGFAFLAEWIIKWLVKKKRKQPRRKCFYQS